jgi:hypothetical protein
MLLRKTQVIFAATDQHLHVELIERGALMLPA